MMHLWDWRRRISDLYHQIRAMPDPETAWHLWRDTRDDLFRTHPQTPLEQQDRAAFTGLPFFAYDPALRFLVQMTDHAGPPVLLDAGTDVAIRAQPFARTAGLWSHSAPS